LSVLPGPIKPERARRGAREGVSAPEPPEKATLTPTGAKRISGSNTAPLSCDRPRTESGCAPMTLGIAKADGFSVTAKKERFKMNTPKTIGLTAVVALVVIRCGAAQPAPSTDDLWDVSRGVVITGQSQMNTCCCPATVIPFDARDIFGGSFSPACDIEHLDAIFADGKPDGFVHYVEWATPSVMGRSNGTGSDRKRSFLG
jgi:hypothetical protein